MPRLSKQDYVVYVYRPNGWLLKKISDSATSAKVAVKRAKAQIYKEGRLAHFYTFVPYAK